MYESPIEFIESVADHFAIEIQKAKDESVYQAVSKIGIVVDKEELLKALRYDRDQYNKGYAAGVREFAERLLKDYTVTINDGDRVVLDSDIYNLAKEMGVEL